MANIDPGITNMINIRTFLANHLQTTADATVTKTLKITLDTEITSVYNVNVIWDGGEYYIAYTLNNADAGVGNFIHLNKLDAVLPMQIEVVATEPSEVV